MVLIRCLAQQATYRMLDTSLSTSSRAEDEEIDLYLLQVRERLRRQESEQSARKTAEWGRQQSRQKAELANRERDRERANRSPPVQNTRGRERRDSGNVYIPSSTERHPLPFTMRELHSDDISALPSASVTSAGDVNDFFAKGGGINAVQPGETWESEVGREKEREEGAAQLYDARLTNARKNLTQALPKAYPRREHEVAARRSERERISDREFGKGLANTDIRIAAGRASYMLDTTFSHIPGAEAGSPGVSSAWAKGRNMLEGIRRERDAEHVLEADSVVISAGLTPARWDSLHKLNRLSGSNSQREVDVRRSRREEAGWGAGSESVAMEVEKVTRSVEEMVDMVGRGEEVRMRVEELQRLLAEERSKGKALEEEVKRDR